MNTNKTKSKPGFKNKVKNEKSQYNLNQKQQQKRIDFKL